MAVRKNKKRESFLWNTCAGGLFFLFLVVGAVFSEVSARDIFVDNVRGNDEYTGWYTSLLPDENGPVRTISRALKLAQAGDRIVLAKNEEPYRESVTFIGKNHSGAYGKPFILEGNGAVLDGSELISPDSWHYFRDGMFYFRPKYLAYQNLFLNGKPLTRMSIPDDEIPVVKLEPMQWCLYEGHIIFKPEKERMPDEYPLACTSLRCGISLVFVKDVEIRNLTAQGYQNDGIAATNSATNVYLSNVTLRGNARAGVFVGGACTLWVINSTVGNNNAAQLLTENYSRTYILKSDLIANTAPGWVDRGGTVTLDEKVITGGLGIQTPVPAVPEKSDVSENTPRPKKKSAPVPAVDSSPKTAKTQKKASPDTGTKIVVAKPIISDVISTPKTVKTQKKALPSASAESASAKIVVEKPAAPDGNSPPKAAKTQTAPPPSVAATKRSPAAPDANSSPKTTKTRKETPSSTGGKIAATKRNSAL